MMLYSRWIPLTLLLVLVASSTRGQQSTVTPAQAAPFIGTWVLTMTEPEELKGSEQRITIANENGTLAASVQIGKSPPRAVTGIHKDGEMLVLTVNHQAKFPILENGAPIWAVISLTLDGDTLHMAQMLERSRTIKRGSGKAN